MITATILSWELATGHEAEIFMEVDERGRGDALIYVDGEALARATTDEHGGRTTWTAPGIELSTEALGQILSADVAADVMAGLLPQEFPCSDFGRKVVKAAKYLWISATYAAGVGCCVGGLTVGCVVCGLGAELAQEAGSEALDGYCD